MFGVVVKYFWLFLAFKVTGSRCCGVIIEPPEESTAITPTGVGKITCGKYFEAYYSQPIELSVCNRPITKVSWSSGNGFFSNAAGLTCEPLADQIGSSVANSLRHRCDISSKDAVLPGLNDAKMGPANSLHISLQYSKENI